MKPRTPILLTAAFALGQSLVTPSLAQQDEQQRPAARLIEEIIVTARKREESLREVPVAVTAMTADAIAEAGIRDVQDLALMSPGLSYREGFGRATGDANNRPSMRGMSSILGNPNAAFFVDGVYVDGPITAYSMENLERVEVIRGPQATTFGRGTFAGAVNFITRRPGDETQGQFKVDVGSHGYREVSGFLSGPLVEGKLSAEVNARFYDIGSDPEYTNFAPNGADMGAEETKAAGFKLLWTPSDKASLYLNVNWSEDNDGSFAYGQWNGGASATADEINSVGPDTVNCFEPTQIGSWFGVIPINLTRTRGYWCGEIKTPQGFWSDSGGLNGVERETFTTNLIGEFDLGDWSLTSVTGNTVYDYFNAFAAIYEGASVAWGGRDDNKVFSQEFRLSSPADRSVRFTVGGYYYKQQAGDGFDTSFDPIDESPDDIDLDNFSFKDDSEIENRAVFAGVDWDLTDALTLSAEVRYQEEEHSLAGTDSDGNEQFDGSPKIDFDATLPRLALTWNVNDDINLYASIAEGNNPGGFNEDFYDVFFVESERQQWVGERGSYDESEVTAYELGFKGLLAGGRMALNVALFRSEWDKQALTDSDALTNVNGSQSTIAFITNAGESEVQGVELELIAKPTDWLDLNLSYAYANSEFNDYLDENWRDLQDTNGIYTGLDYTGAQVVDSVDPSGQVKGNQLPQTPENMASLSTTFHWPMENDSEAYFRLDYSYESKRFVQAANLAWMGASDKVNARFGYRGENWDISIWAKNLTNDDTPEVVTRLLDFRSTMFFPSQDRPPNPSPFNFPPAPPPPLDPAYGLRFSFLRDFTVTAPRSRQYGVTASYRF